MENLTGMIPHTPEGVRQFGEIMAAPVDPNAYLRDVVQAALGNVASVKSAIDSGKLSSYESGKAVGQIAPQLAMLFGGLKTAGAVGSVPQQPLTPMAAGVRGSGKFRAAYQIDKDIGDALEKLGASRESGSLAGEYAVRNLTQGLDKTQIDELGKFLVSKRLAEVQASLPQPPAQPHPQILPASEMNRIASDPAIANAIQYYANEIRPDIEAIRLRGRLSPQAAAGKAPEFISLIPKEQPVPKQYGKVQQASRLGRKTRFAQQAKGTATEYNTNVAEVIKESYGEAMRKANLNDFYDLAHSKGLAQYTTEYGPNGAYSALNDRGLDPRLLEQLRAATERPPKQTGAMAAVQAVQRGATSVALTANPAELVNHMRRQLNILAAKPPVGSGLIARLEWLLPYIGPKTGAFLRTVFADADSPAFQATMKDIFEAGGGSSRSFSETYAPRTMAKIPLLGWLQRKTHQLLFGVPKGRGFNGWDLRMRVQLEQIRRAAEGNRDPQRIREFANQIGQYGAHPDWIIGALRNLNPYAATTLPMRVTELKTAAGFSGLKAGAARAMMLQAETLLRGTGGTILALTVANKLLSNKYPWQNDAGHEFDLNMGPMFKGRDGKQIYIKFRVLAPELSRPVATLGLPAMSRERRASNPDYLGALATSLANQGLSIVGGPAQNTLLTATTGMVPYLVKAPGKAPQMMDITNTPPGGSRGLEQLKQAAAGLNPLIRSGVPEKYEPEVPAPLKYVERPLSALPGELGRLAGGAVKPFGSVFTESYEKKKPKHQQTVAQKAATRRRTQRQRMQKKREYERKQRGGGY